MVDCETCGFEMKLGHGIETGEIVSCPDCGKEYEVKSLDPLKLAFLPEAEEDWGE